MAGVDAEIRAFFANNAHNYIMASRISQGHEDHKESSQEERDDIVVRWIDQKPQLKSFYAMKQRQKGKSRDASPAQPERRGTTPGSGEELRRSLWQHSRRISTDESRHLLRRSTADTSNASSSSLNEDARLSVPGATREQDDEFEQAIQEAVRQTSTGDPTEDARIEQAVRASVLAVRSRTNTLNSVVNSSNSATFSSGPASTFSMGSQEIPPQLPPRASTDGLPNLEDITDEEYQELIEQAVRLSVMEHERQPAFSRRRSSSTDDENDEEFQRVLQRSQTEQTASSNERDEEYRRVLEESQAEYAKARASQDNEEDDDEALRKAIEASQAEQQQQDGRGGGGGDDEEELRRAIEESERAHREELARLKASRTEEDIVMEYVKRQSLAEQQFRMAARGKGKQGESSGSGSGSAAAGGNGDDDLDEDLKAALEQSMQSIPENKNMGGSGSGSGSGGSGSSSQP